MTTVVEPAFPMARSSSPAEAGAAFDKERRGRASDTKRITGYADSSRHQSHTRSKAPIRRYGRVTLEQASARRSSATSSSSEVSSGESELESDSEQDRGHGSRRSRARTAKLGFNVAQDLDTFAFDSDEEGEQLRSTQQQNDWLLSQGKNVRDVRFILGNSKKDGIVARQLLTEIGFDIHSRFPEIDSDDSGPQRASRGAQCEASTHSNKRAQAAISPSTSPQVTSRARLSSSPIMDTHFSRSQSPEWERNLSPLQFARKPSLTAGSYGTVQPRKGAQPSARPEASSLRRLASNPEQPFVDGRDSTSRNGAKIASTSRVAGSQSGHATGERRGHSVRNGSISNIDSLPWVRNLKGDTQQDASTVGNGEDDESDSSQISFPRAANADTDKKDRRLSGTMTSVCKATATTFCDRKFCDRHGPQAQVLSLASGSLRQSLGHVKYRTRSQSETHIDLNALKD